MTAIEILEAAIANTPVADELQDTFHQALEVAHQTDSAEVAGRWFSSVIDLAADVLAGVAA